MVDFSSFEVLKLFIKVFARTITRRWEGFILKGCDDFYSSFNRTRSSIKLKKNYIASFGDTAYFVIVGGPRDATDKQKFGLKKL